MFAQTLYVQWKWNRDFLGFFTAIGFVAPLVVFWIALPQLGLTSARELVSIGGAIGGTALTLAVLSGLTVAWQGYGVDDRTGHIYALSLPITRQRALAIRAVSAAILLALPALGIWLGATLAAGQLTLPSTLHAYAGSLALRALLVAWLAHCGMFALRYSTGRRAKLVLGMLVAGVALLGLSLLLAPAAQGWVKRAAELVTSDGGPLGVLFGRWTLIDV